MGKILLAFFLCGDVSLPGQVQFKQLKDRVEVSIRGKLFTALHFGVEARKPFLFPLQTPSGQKVTRGFPLAPVVGDPTDHPHQTGLWTGSEQTNGIDFWENDPSYKRPRMGSILFRDVTRAEGGEREGVLSYTADWITPEGKTLVGETHSMRFFAAGPDVNGMAVEVVFKPKGEEAVVFEDHQDAVIGVRLGPAFDEKNGGYPENAEGFRGENGIRGRASRWVEWKTKLEG